MDNMMEELVMTKARIYLREYVSEQFLNGLTIETVRDPMSQHLIMTLKAFVWSREVHKESIDYVSYPENWKESLKERFLPQMLKDRYPVKYMRKPVTIHHNHMCPHFNVDARGKHFHFMLMNKPYQYPEKKPLINLIELMEEMYAKSLSRMGKPIRWKMHPEYYAYLQQEMMASMRFFGTLESFMGVMIDVDASIVDIHLIEE